MRIPSLLQKLNELAALPEPRNLIEIDLMLDYTRVLYADLLDLRGRALPAQQEVAAQQQTPKPVPLPVPVLSAPPPESKKPVPAPAIPQEPTLEELAQGMTTDDDDEAIELPQAQPAPEQVKPAIIAETRQVPMRGAPVPPVPPVKKDIRSRISINDKYQIMSELFGNDKSAYEDALDHVNAAGNETIAVRWLQDRLWVTEDHSDVAQSFYDLVRQFKNEA